MGAWEELIKGGQRPKNRWGWESGMMSAAEKKKCINKHVFYLRYIQKNIHWRHESILGFRKLNSWITVIPTTCLWSYSLIKFYWSYIIIVFQICFGNSWLQCSTAETDLFVSNTVTTLQPVLCVCIQPLHVNILQQSKRMTAKIRVCRCGLGKHSTGTASEERN